MYFINTIPQVVDLEMGEPLLLRAGPSMIKIAIAPLSRKGVFCS
jgi:hypothetical protein